MKQSMKLLITMRRNKISMSLINFPQFAHFGIVGIAATCVDLVVYHAAVEFGLLTTVSKSFSFISGLTVSYLGNANITFRRKNRKPIRFLITYACSFILNVSTNEVGLNWLFEGKSHALTMSWLIATGISALFNFLCLKKWVFTS